MIQFQWLNWEFMTKKIEQLGKLICEMTFFPLLETFELWVINQIVCNL